MTPLNIINQLKYRYDIEIGCARRSSIRKIIEKDDTSMNKTLILFLSKVLPSTSTTVPTLYVELCDGWYPIKAQLDTYLSDYVRRGKIKIGDKLAIFSPELLGCPKDGCDPLEAPEDMHFKLSVNSTRKAKWYAKLGYLKPQRPLVVNLKSLKPNSIVGVIDVLIERIYPIMYMEKKPDGSKVYRNQKQEDLLIYSQMRDMENKSSHFDGDFDQSIEDKRKSLEDIKPGNNSFNNNKQVQNVGRRDVTQILKIRVRDYINKNSQEISCLITVWQNAADLYEKIKEGQRVMFFNLTSTTQKNIYQDSSNISLGTNRMTFYKNKKIISSTIASNRVFYEYKDLYESKISNVFNEVDICGIVVKHSSNNYNTLVYLTNLSETNSIVCIGFPKGPELYGFKDVLKISNCVACLNLKFTRKKENLKYPYLISSEMSIFTQKVHALKFLSAQFTQLNELSNKQENKQRLSELAEEINQQPKLSSGSTYENPLNKPSNFKLNTSNTKNNDTKEIKLASIIEASETIPINMKSGLRQPGLVNKPKFLSPAVPRVTESQHNKNQLKRRSDTFELNSNTSLISCDDEDSFISNCDLDSLCKSNSSFNVSMALSESIAKRIKKN
ncbi:unnamed protein product [Brachionus calyciflorus]|uniref:Uncharacterized protein n=1 Tax=Brachionus calyciflorus TaxID=104777 RepID=A0A813ME63_9BILA|nr:unnamed protein product [Brachionus calyciflorus]